MLPGFQLPTQKLEVFVPGKAHGKDFVGFAMGKRVIINADRASQNYMREIEKELMSAAAVYGWNMPDSGQPVNVVVDVQIGVFKSWSNTKRQQLLGKSCTSKPDNDNVENCVFDALTGHLPPKKSKASMSPGEQEVAARRKRVRVNGLLSGDEQIAYNRTHKTWSLPEDEGVWIRISTGEYVDPRIEARDAALRSARSVLKDVAIGETDIQKTLLALAVVEGVLS